MADITITPGNVLPGTGARLEEGTAGGTITAGMPLYLDSATNTLKAADANDTAAKAAAVGIALHGASSGQPLKYQVAGPITIGGTAVVGTIYCVSENAGGVAPHTDLGANEYVTVLGVGISATQIKMSINVSGVQVPA